MRQTTFPKGTHVCTNRKWYLVDAKDAVLGRIASKIAARLIGKDRCDYTTYANNASGVVVINARHIKVTGNKLDDKIFYWHTGYPGGIKQRTVRETLKSNYPERVLFRAIKGMLPSGPLGRAQLRNLRVYADENYKEVAQKPELWDVKSEHRMNER